MAEEYELDIPALANELLYCYAVGMFPMGLERDTSAIRILEPSERCVFLLDRFHIPRRLRRTIRGDPFEIRINHDFATTIRACADTRRETWINSPIRRAFVLLHQQGLAHSVEAYDGDKLVGGLYGLSAHGMFFGESMFSIKRDSSKIALVYLVDHLIRCGFICLDAQFPTSHLLSMGAVVVQLSEYRRLLKKASRKGAQFDTHISVDPGSVVVQRMSQTS